MFSYKTPNPTLILCSRVPIKLTISEAGKLHQSQSSFHDLFAAADHWQWADSGHDNISNIFHLQPDTFYLATMPTVLSSHLMK